MKNYNRKRKRRKLWPIILPIAVLVVGLIGFAGYKIIGNNGSNIFDKTEYATYEYESTLLDEYGDSGTATRCKVSIVSSPIEAGHAITSSQYVTKGGKIQLSVVPADGYEFLGWYVSKETSTPGTYTDLSFLSSDANYTYSPVNENTVLVAKFAVDMIDISADVSSSGGGIVTGGGVINNTDNESYVVLTANSTPGYEFEKWEYIDGEGKQNEIYGRNCKTIKVAGSSYTGTETVIKVSKDTKFTAYFTRESHYVTVSMFPAAGGVALDIYHFSLKIPPKPNHYEASVTKELTDTGINTSAKLQLSSVQVYDTKDQKYKDVYRYTIKGLYEYNDGVLSTIMKYDPLAYDKDKKTQEVWCTYNANGELNRDHNMVWLLDTANASDAANYAAIGASYPIDGGTVNGGGSSTLSYSFNLTAVPNNGYKFDHWEWVQNGTTYTSKDNPVAVTPQGYQLYTAHFVPNYYNVYIASETPADGGSINGIGNYAVDTTGKATANISIKTVDGYVIDSIDYTMNNVPNTVTGGSDQNNFNFTINDITGDVGLEVKYKRTGNYTLAARIDSPDNIANTVEIKDPSGARVDITDGTRFRIEKTGINSVSPAPNYKLVANIGTGYSFKYWVRNDGVTSPGTTSGSINELSVPVDNDYVYTGVFEKSAYDIEVKADPNTYGTATVSTGGGTETNKVSVTANGTVTLKATPKSKDDYAFDYWSNSAGTRFSGTTDSGTGVNTLEITNVNWSDTYVAHFKLNKIKVQIVPSPSGAGIVQLNSETAVSVETTYNVNNGDTIQLKAEESSDSKFVRWEIAPMTSASTASKQVFSDKEISVTNVTDDITCTAIFAEDVHTVEVVASPAEGGSAYVNGAHDKHDFAFGEKVNLSVSPAAGYVFDYWTDSKGNRFYDENYTIDSISSDEKFTAYFIKSDVSITVAPSSASGGTVQLDNNAAVSSSTTYKNIQSGSNHTITAIPSTKSKFVRWEVENRSTGEIKAYSDATTTITQVNSNIVCTAIFSDELNSVTVVSSPIEGGVTTVDGKVNSASYKPGEQATLSATASNGYKFQFFKDKAGNKYTDNPHVITVNGSETYTAYFVKGEPEITVNVAPKGAGIVRLNGSDVNLGTVTKLKAGDNITLTAEVIDSNKYVFERWESSDGQISTSNPLQLVNVTSSENYTAVFNIKASELGIKLLASPASGGTVTKNISSDGKSATLKAIPHKGYDFVGWTKDGINFSASLEVTVNDMSDGVKYVAEFVKNKNYDAKTEIVTEHFYNDKRKVTDPSYSVTRQSMEANAASTIAGEKANQYADSTPGVKDRVAVENAKDLYEDIEMLDDRSALLADDELVSSTGIVVPVTLISDTAREEELAQKYKDKKFGEYYGYEIVTVKDAIIPDELSEGSVTYLWKNQSVDDKDNIFIIFETSDGKDDWASAIIDEGGTLRFTIKDIGKDCRLSIVRVNYNEQ